MSHFTVLVVGDDVDAALAPYDENTEVAPRREHLDAEEVASMAGHYGIDPADLSALAAKMDDWRGRTGGVDREGLFCMTTYNPASKWDWYVVGGRWRGFFTTKPGTSSGEQGDLDTFDRLAQSKGEPVREVEGVDVVRKGDVDTDAMEAAAVARAKETWRLYAKAVQGTEPNETWDVIRARFPEDADAVREAYINQPRIAAVHAAEVLRERVGSMADWDKFLIGEERYVEEARLGAFATFAVVVNGEWHEHGEMGWWGVAHDEKDDWPETFRRLWDQIPEDATVSCVDCHI